MKSSNVPDFLFLCFALEAVVGEWCRRSLVEFSNRSSICIRRPDIAAKVNIAMNTLCHQAELEIDMLREQIDVHRGEFSALEACTSRETSGLQLLLATERAKVRRSASCTSDRQRSEHTRQATNVRLAPGSAETSTHFFVVTTDS